MRKSCLSPGCSGAKLFLYQAYPLVETAKVWMTFAPMALYQATCSAGFDAAQCPGFANGLRRLLVGAQL